MNLPDLHFIRPWWLLALLPLALLVWRSARNSGSGAAWRGLVDAHLLPHLLEAGSGSASRWPPILLAIGGLIGILALAGPTWERLPQPVFQAERYQVLVLDISASMNAPDVPPSRLAQARFEVLDLLKRAEGQTALIAYGAEPYVVSPLTGDADTIALQVPGLTSELLPVSGKNAAAALQKAGELLKQSAAHDADVILICDGVNDPAAARDAAQSLNKAGHRVSVLAVGTEQGAPVPTSDGGFLKDAGGAILLPRLDDESLAMLADSGGGRLVRSRPDDLDLDALGVDLRPDLAAGKEDQQLESDQWREEGPWLLLALLPLAALAFRKGWFSPLLLIAFIGPPDPAMAFGWKDLWLTPDQQGRQAMEQSQPEQAAELFDQSGWRAAAHYQAGNYDKALENLERAGDARSLYNKGNALARLGRLEDAVSAYDHALTLNPSDEDARHNKALVEDLLKQQSQQQQQDGQQGDSEDGEQDDSQPSQQQDSQAGDESGSGEESESQDGDNVESQQHQLQQENADNAPERSTAGQESDEASDEENTEQSVAEPSQPTPPPQQSQTAGAANDEPQEDGEEPGLKDLIGEPVSQQQRMTAASQPQEGNIPESAQAAEQWLRRVPDDPGGLLRQRFLLQHLRNTGKLP